MQPSSTLASPYTQLDELDVGTLVEDELRLSDDDGNEEELDDELLDEEPENDDELDETGSPPPPCSGDEEDDDDDGKVISPSARYSGDFFMGIALLEPAVA